MGWRKGTGALVILDEAYGTGVLGSMGARVGGGAGGGGRVAVTVGTLSKALGSVGGFVCGGRAAIETLVNAEPGDDLYDGVAAGV